VGYSTAELEAAADDPIIARHLARLAAPAPPPEPPPSALTTEALLTALPGRFDLVMEAAWRLCRDTGDTKTATLRTAEKMAGAVAARATPAAVLLDCLRQATGPKARHAGKVLVAAWGRDARASP
jgi:hypothetical protein